MLYRSIIVACSLAGALAFSPGAAPRFASPRAAVMRVANEPAAAATSAVTADDDDSMKGYSKYEERPDDPTLSCYPAPESEEGQWLCAEDRPTLRTDPGDSDDSY